MFLANLCTPLPTFIILGSTPHSLTMSKKRNSTFSFAKRFGSPSLWAKYHFYHNKTLAYLRHLKSKFFYNLLTSSSLRSFWSAVKCIHSKPVSIPSLIYNGSPVTSSSSKDVLNQYFSPLVSTHQLPLYLLLLIIPLLHYMTTLQIFSANQMKSAISFLVFLLTLLLVLTVSPLLYSTTQLLIFHLLFPSQLVYFLQTGKTPILYLSPNKKLFFIPSDYRPISLLSLPSKILEPHVFNYLYKFCSAHNILSNCQFGF